MFCVVSKGWPIQGFVTRSSLIVAENIGHTHRKIIEIIYSDKHNLCSWQSWKQFHFHHLECRVITSLLIHSFKTLGLLYLWKEAREIDVNRYQVGPFHRAYQKHQSLNLHGSVHRVWVLLDQAYQAVVVVMNSVFTGSDFSE